MRFQFRGLRSLIVGAVLIGGAAIAPGVATAQDATGFIANVGNQGIQVLGPSVPQAQRAARFRQLLDADFDMPSISQFVLGPFRRSMSPEQQQQFVPLFREYIVQAYTARLGMYGGAPFQVTGSRPAGDETIVTSQVQRPGGAVEIDWYVGNRSGRPLIEDVVVDGVSMKVTHRNEFAAIIQRNGGQPSALLAALRQKVGASG